LAQQLGRALSGLAGSKAERSARVAELVASAPDDSEFGVFIREHAKAAIEHGVSALLFAATARASQEPLRQAAEEWLVQQEPGSVAPWLRYVDGPLLTPRIEPVLSVKAHKDQVLGLVPGPDGSFWSWGSKTKRELKRSALDTGAELAKARSTFDLGHGDVNAAGWLALGCPHDESQVAVWDPAGKRAHRFDTGRDFSRPRWVPQSPTPALLVADGCVSLFYLDKKEPRKAWAYEPPDKNTTRPLKHSVPLPNGREAVLLEIDWNQAGRAHAIFVSLSEGKVVRRVALELGFGNEDSGSVALSPGGKLLAFASDLAPMRGVFVLDLDSGATRHHFAPDAVVTALAFESDERLWCGTAGGLVLSCDLLSAEVQALRAASTVVAGLFVAGEQVYVALSDGSVVAFAKKECIFTIDELPRADLATRILAVESEPRALILTETQIREVREGDASARDVMPGEPVWSDAATDAAGSFVAIAKKLNQGKPNLPEETELTIYARGRQPDANAAPAPRRFRIPGIANRLVVNERAALIEVESSEENTHRVQIVPHDGAPSDLYESPDGLYIWDICACPAIAAVACAVDEEGVVLVDEAGTASHLSENQGTPVLLQSFGPFLLVLREDGKLDVFDLESRKRRAELVVTTPEARVSQQHPKLAGSLETDRALVGLRTGAALLFCLSSGTPVATLKHAKGVEFIGMSRDGRRFFTIDPEGDLVVWDSLKGERVTSHSFAKAPWNVVWVGNRELLVLEPRTPVTRLRLET